MSPEALEARRKYMRDWKRTNRDRVNSTHKEWRERNKERYRMYAETYWEKKAKGEQES